MKISKELLSEVLDIKIEDIVDFKIFMNELFYYRELLIRANCQGKTSKHRDSIQQSINIYEFAFKCKEWALSEGYFIYSTHELSFIKSLSLETIETFANGKDTEIECIIKACEWILEKNN